MQECAHKSNNDVQNIIAGIISVFDFLSGAALCLR